MEAKEPNCLLYDSMRYSVFRNKSVTNCCGDIFAPPKFVTLQKSWPNQKNVFLFSAWKNEVNELTDYFVKQFSVKGRTARGYAMVGTGV